VSRPDTEHLRSLAYEILEDLRDRPEGYTLETLPTLEHSATHSIRRAICYLQDNGCGVTYSHATKRWRLSGERRHLPASALSRECLLAELAIAMSRHGVARAADPLDALRAMEPAPRWNMITAWPSSWSRRAHGLIWRLDYHRHVLVLTAYGITNDATDFDRAHVVIRVEKDCTDETALRFADYLIADRHAAVVQTIAAIGQTEAASW
jgi:hypothetical protein